MKLGPSNMECYAGYFERLSKTIIECDPDLAHIFLQEAAYLKQMGDLTHYPIILKSGFPAVTDQLSYMEAVLRNSRESQQTTEELAAKIRDTNEGLSEQDRLHLQTLIVGGDPAIIEGFLKPEYGFSGVGKPIKEIKEMSEEGGWFVITDTTLYGLDKRKTKYSKKMPFKLSAYVKGYLGEIRQKLTSDKNMDSLEKNFIRWNVSETREARRYAYHDPKMNDLFGLPIPVLITEEGKKRNIYTMEPKDKDKLTSLNKSEEDLKSIMKRASGGNLYGYQEYKKVYGSGKLTTGHEINPKDPGITTLLNYLSGIGDSKAELLELDNSQKKSVSELVGSIAPKYTLEPDTILVNHDGNIYPSPIFWNCPAGHLEGVRDLQNAITDHMKDGGSLISFFSESDSPIGIVYRLGAASLSSLERNLCKGYFLVSADQLSLPKPENSLKKLGGTSPIRVNLSKTLKNHLPEINKLQESSVLLPDYKPDGGFIYGELGRVWAELNRLKNPVVGTDPQDIMVELLGRDAAKKEILSKYGNNIQGLVADIERAYLRNGGNNGR